MAETKEEAPKFIEDYEKIKKHAKAIADTAKRHHREAYYKAVDDVLMEEGKPHANYEKLNKTEHQIAFADKMADHYVDKSKDYFKVKESEENPLGPLEKNMLLTAYAKTSRQDLRGLVAKHKEDYEIEKHEEIAHELVDHLEKELSVATVGHIVGDQKKDLNKARDVLLKESGAEKYVNKDYIQLPEAIAIYDVYKKNGVLSRKILQKVLKLEKPKLKDEEEEKKKAA